MDENEKLDRWQPEEFEPESAPIDSLEAREAAETWVEFLAEVEKVEKEEKEKLQMEMEIETCCPFHSRGGKKSLSCGGDIPKEENTPKIDLVSIASNFFKPLVLVFLLFCLSVSGETRQSPSRKFNRDISRSEKTLVQSVFNSCYTRGGAVAPFEPDASNQVYIIRLCRGTTLVTWEEWFQVQVIWYRVLAR